MDRPEKTAELCVAAAALRTRLAIEASPAIAEQPPEAVLEEARRRLGDAEFEVRRRGGEELSMEQAIAQALALVSAHAETPEEMTAAAGLPDRDSARRDGPA